MEREAAGVGDDGVPGVRAPLESHDDVMSAHEEIDDLRLPLVTPLTTHDNRCRH